MKPLYWLCVVAWALCCGLAFGQNNVIQPPVSLLSDVRPGPILPMAGQLYSFGDSQTAGINAAYSGGLLPVQHRWVSMVATQGLRSLAVSNYGIGAARMSFDFTAPTPASIFNSIGRLAHNWNGVATLLGGWNDAAAANETQSDAFFANLQAAYAAAIARLLIDDWGAMTVYGWTRSSQANGAFPGTPNTPGFVLGSTVGATPTELNHGQFSTSDLDSIPFQNSGISLSARYHIVLRTNNYVEVGMTNKRAAAVFFDSSADGATVQISVNGTVRHELNTFAVSLAGARWPRVAWIENLPAAGCTVRAQLVAPTGSNVYFTAIGWVDRQSTLTPYRQIIVGTTTGNTNSARSVTNLFKLARAAELAVAEFASDYPVYLADNYTTYAHSYAEPSDPSHFRPLGNQFIAANFLRAYRPSGRAGSNSVSRVP